mgnify:CR=1 FL=1
MAAPADALLGGEEQGLTVLFPVQRCVHLVVPFGADDFPVAGFAFDAVGGALGHRHRG